jgi:hypothetical protein
MSAIGVAVLVTAAVFFGKNLIKTDNAGAAVYQTWASAGQYTWTAPADGSYRFEAWGAQGGHAYGGSSNGIGGKGGYATGTLYLTAGQTVYVYVGGQGYTAGHNGVDHLHLGGGYNGGGGSWGAPVGFNVGAGGGGASDIRTSTDLNDRVIVAGGGGGSGGLAEWGSLSFSPRADGGMGGVGGATQGQNQGTGHGGGPGTDSAGGAPGQSTKPSSPGSNVNKYCTSGTGGGGGGGWYGGGGGSGGSMTSASVGNFSSQAATNAYTYAGTFGSGGGGGAAQGYRENCYYPEPGSGGGGGSSYVTPTATFAETISGANLMPAANATGDNQTVGNSGGGFVRIADANPRIISVSRKYIPTVGGVEVTIYGECLDSNTKIYVDGVEAPVNSVSADGKQIVITAPAHVAGEVDVSAGDASGTIFSTLPKAFVYDDIKIFSISPDYGHVSGGTVVKITGQYFTENATVTMDGIPATVDSVSADGTYILIATPPHAAGKVDVTVTDTTGVATLSDAYTYYDDISMAIHSVTPSSGPEAGGTEVTITGISFGSRPFDQEDYSYTTCTYQTFTAESDGPYELNVWGASGGASNGYSGVYNLGGKGGYSVGTVNLVAGDNLYIYIGAPGTTPAKQSTASGGCNGGGTASRGGGAGGGGTDIRTVVGSLYSRIIVAGGGGGGASDTSGTGGVGGGLSGGTGGNGNTSLHGSGGGQSSPGSRGSNNPGTGYTNPTNGYFGSGGSGGTGPLNGEGTAYTYGAGAGGGGWYGGGGGVGSVNDGGGGSGYILTADSYKPSGYLPTSKYYLQNAATYAGNTSFPAPAGGNETGHSGNGYARIRHPVADAIKFGNADTGYANCQIISWTDTEIKCTTTKHVASLVDVVAANETESATAFDAYEYLVEPYSITAVTPNTGPTYGGTEVTITGSLFTENTHVIIGGQEVPVTLVDSGTIKITTPPHLPGPVDIIIYDDNGSATMENAFTYLPMTVTNLTPDKGWVGGGTAVTITGTYFTANTKVQVDGVEATVQTVNGSGTSLTFITPVHADPELVGVLVYDDYNDVFLEDAYTYELMSATSLSPTYGPEGGGISVTITGKYFNSSTRVKVDGTSVSVNTINSAGTELTITMPAHVAGTVDVEIYDDYTTATLQFEYKAMTILSLTPNYGHTSGGTEVTISGLYMTTNTKIKFDGLEATFVSLSPDGTTMVVRTPAHVAETVDVVADNSVITSTIENGFTYYDETGLTVLSITPDNGPTTGGTEVTIRGIYFGNERPVAPTAKAFDFVSGCAAQEFTAPISGDYNLEVWGAEGGYRSSADYGGNGGYSTGVVTLNAGEKLYVYVGGSGRTGGTSGGCNGGGSRSSYYGGGGATDIRLSNGAWNLSASLYSRIIVAGGGGSDGATNRAGGFGGGLTGESRSNGLGTGGGGATQSAGGSGGNSNSGTFGIGGTGLYRSNGYGGAGGGGWYGGGGVYPDASADDDRGGGGGSGYVLTATSTKPSGYAPDSKYYLSSASTVGGNTSFKSPTGTDETGHTGDGFARITYSGFVTDAIKFGTTNSNYATCNIISWTDTEIKCTTSAHKAELVDVIVEGSTDSDTLPQAYTYTRSGYNVGDDGDSDGDGDNNGILHESGPTMGGTEVTLTGTYFDSQTRVKIGGIEVTPTYLSPDGTTMKFTTPPHASGVVDIIIFDNDSSTALTGAFTYIPLNVTSMTPTSGPVSGGTTLTFTGQSFTSGTKVKIDSAEVAVVSINSAGTEMTVTTPAHSAGEVDVQVYDDFDSYILKYTYHEIQVTSITPNYGPTIGGTAITINGEHFDSNTKVKIDGVDVTPTVSPDGKTITVVAPPHAAGPVDIVVYDNYTTITKEDAFTYYENISLTPLTISPTYGPVIGGTEVTITGIAFGDQTGTAKLGTTSSGYADCNVTTWTDTKIICTTSAHAEGLVDVVIQINQESGTLTGAYEYVPENYHPTPSITSITPDEGPETGGTLVTITGERFGSTAETVELGTATSGYATCTIISWTDTEIQCTTSAHTAGIVDVKITIGEDSTTLTDAYTYTLESFISVGFVNDPASSCGPQTNSTVDFQIINPSFANIITTSACITSVATNHNGYILSLSATGNDSSLISTANPADKIPSISNSLTNPAPLSAGSWGFALPKSNMLASDSTTLLHNATGLTANGFDATYTSVNHADLSTSPARLYKFAGVPTHQNPALLKQTSTATIADPFDPASGNDPTATFFGVAIGRETPDGIYTTTVVYTIESRN